MNNNEIAEELLRSVWTDNRIDNDQYVVHRSRIEAIVKQLRSTSECAKMGIKGFDCYTCRLNALENAFTVAEL